MRTVPSGEVHEVQAGRSPLPAFLLAQGPLLIRRSLLNTCERSWHGIRTAKPPHPGMLPPLLLSSPETNVQPWPRSRPALLASVHVIYTGDANGQRSIQRCIAQPSLQGRIKQQAGVRWHVHDSQENWRQNCCTTGAERRGGRRAEHGKGGGCWHRAVGTGGTALSTEAVRKGATGCTTKKSDVASARRAGRCRAWFVATMQVCMHAVPGQRVWGRGQCTGGLGGKGGLVFLCRRRGFTNLDSNARGPAQRNRVCIHRASQRGSVCSHQLGAVGQGPPELFGRCRKRAPNVAGLHKARPRACTQLPCTWGEARPAGLPASVHKGT